MNPDKRMEHSRYCLAGSSGETEKASLCPSATALASCWRAGESDCHQESKGLVGNVFSSVFLPFLGPHPWHMEVPRLGVESELLPMTYARATATPDLSHICDLYHSSRQCQILNPLSEARDQTHILMDTSWVLNLLGHKGSSFALCFLSQEEKW